MNAKNVSNLFTVATLEGRNAIRQAADAGVTLARLSVLSGVSHQALSRMVKGYTHKRDARTPPREDVDTAINAMLSQAIAAKVDGIPANEKRYYLLLQAAFSVGSMFLRIAKEHGIDAMAATEHVSKMSPAERLADVREFNAMLALSTGDEMLTREDELRHEKWINERMKAEKLAQLAQAAQSTMIH